MKINFLQIERTLYAVLFVLLLSWVGMTKGYAYDFSAVCSTGQTLYYNIIDASNHYVELVAPANNTSSGWNGYTKPSGNILLSSSVDYDSTTYTITSIGNYAFYNCSGLTGDLVIPNLVTSIARNAFKSCSGLTSLTLSDSLITIGDYAFDGCRGLTGDLVIPDFVTSIGSRAFFECSGLTSLTIGNSVTGIGESAFYRCNSLEGSLIIPNSVISIGQFAFYDCRNLTSLALGSSLCSIGNNTFADCNKLTSLIALAETPPTLTTTTFTHVLASIPVYVPCGSVDSYQTASVWSAFSNIMGMCAPGTITVVAEPMEGGTVVGADTYECGTSCTVSATASDGYTFMYWTENETVVSTHAEFTFIVSTDRNLVAHFTLPLSINAIADPAEGGIVTGSGEYEYGSTCTVSATPNENYTFMYWTKDGTRVSSQPTYSFTVTSESEVVAHFTLPISISVVVNPTEGGIVTGMGEYDYGGLCTLTATPNEGYCFYYWSENGVKLTSSSIYSFTVSEEKSIEANFGWPFVVTTSVNIEEGGTVTGAGLYDYDSTCTLTATPNEGYMFLHWSRNGEVIACSSSYSFCVYENAEVEAVFMSIDGTLVGGHDQTNSVLPTKVDSYYSMSQQIYTPDEIGGIGNITSISFFNPGEAEFSGEVPDFPDPDDFKKTSGENVRSVDIYLVHTEKTEFEDEMDWIAVTEADRVFRGNMILTKGYWITLNFDTPFNYNGTSNLAIVFVDNTGNATNFTMGCRVFSAQGNQAICVNRESSGFDPINPSGYYGSLYSMKNQIILNLSGFDITVTSSDAEAGTASGSGQYAFGSICTLSATSNEGFAFANWTKEGEVVSTDAVYSFIVTEEAAYVANFVPNSIQTIMLEAGFNWVSVNVEITLEELQNALVEALPGTSITIYSQGSGNTTYNGSRWRGQLATMDVSETYMINVITNCEIVLEGMPINPMEHSVTIRRGFTWIAFPLSMSMTLTNAFADFVVSGDMVISQSEGTSTYSNRWRGPLITLDPGKGYIYNSVAADDKTLIFPLNAR